LVREPGFPTLVYIILEQQVPLASAKAAFDRLNSAVRRSHTRFLNLRTQSCCASASAARKLSNPPLAESLSRRHFDLRYSHDLHGRCRTQNAHRLQRHRKLDRGHLSTERRAPARYLAVGDLALATAVQEVKQLRKRPSPERWKTQPALASVPRRPRPAFLASLFEQARPTHFGISL